jgi:hypothetical protein
MAAARSALVGGGGREGDAAGDGDAEGAARLAVGDAACGSTAGGRSGVTVDAVFDELDEPELEEREELERDDDAAACDDCGKLYSVRHAEDVTESCEAPDAAEDADSSMEYLRACSRIWAGCANQSNSETNERSRVSTTTRADERPNNSLGTTGSINAHTRQTAARLEGGTPGGGRGTQYTKETSSQLSQGLDVAPL